MDSYQAIIDFIEHEKPCSPAYSHSSWVSIADYTRGATILTSTFKFNKFAAVVLEFSKSTYHPVHINTVEKVA